MDALSGLSEGSIEVYEINGWIHEQHGEYNVYLAVWDAEPLAKTLVGNTYEKAIVSAQPSLSEHRDILEVLMSALSRNAQKIETPLL